MNETQPPKSDERTAALAMETDDVLAVERRVIRWWHPVLLLVALALLYWFAESIDEATGLRSYLHAMRDWIEHLDEQGPLFFMLIYVVLTVVGIPGSWLTLAAGALFGSLVGVLVVVIASNISAAISFLIARHWMRHRVEKWANRSKRFRQLNRLAERHGPAVVLVVRLVNLFPFAVANYGLGMTKVHFRTYLLWSFVGKLPGTIVMVVGIDAIIDAILLGQMPWRLIVVVLVTVVLLVVALRLVHQRLNADVG